MLERESEAKSRRQRGGEDALHELHDENCLRTFRECESGLAREYFYTFAGDSPQGTKSAAEKKKIHHRGHESTEETKEIRCRNNGVDGLDYGSNQNFIVAVTWEGMGLPPLVAGSYS